MSFGGFVMYPYSFLYTEIGHTLKWQNVKFFWENKKKKETICFKGLQRPLENQQIEFQGENTAQMHTHCICFLVFTIKVATFKDSM